jgi:hypothetical protein
VFVDSSANWLSRYCWHTCFRRHFVCLSIRRYVVFLKFCSLVLIDIAPHHSQAPPWNRGEERGNKEHKLLHRHILCTLPRRTTSTRPSGGDMVRIAVRSCPKPEESAPAPSGMCRLNTGAAGPLSSQHHPLFLLLQGEPCAQRPQRINSESAARCRQ